MSSLLNRLKGLQAEVDVPLTDLSHLSLTDLEQEKVSFGQKHLGHTFSQAWEDQQWINFMVSKYAESKVMSHRRLIRFVELKVEAHEAAQAVIPVLPPKESQASAAETADHSGRRFIQPKAKAYDGGFPVPTIAMDEELQELAEFEMYSSGTIPPVPMPLSQDPDFQAMTERMLHMETALTKVIRHLEDQTEKKTD